MPGGGQDLREGAPEGGGGFKEVKVAYSTHYFKGEESKQFESTGCSSRLTKHSKSICQITISKKFRAAPFETERFDR